MRLTYRTQLLNSARHQIEADMTEAIMVELKWLWQRVYPSIRELREKRDNLQKFDKVDGSLWQQFQSRLDSRLADLIAVAADKLGNLEQSFWQQRGYNLSVSTDTIIRQYQTQLAQREGREVKDIGETTRREMGTKIAEWFNTPAKPLQSLVEELKPWVSESRAARIATTETTWLNSVTTAETMNQLGFDTYKFQSKRDEITCTRPIEFNGQSWAGCRGLHGQEFSANGDVPPTHPNCRCDMIPITQ